MAFSKELEEVIEAALADGVITEKERAVLHKKALQEGADPDEVDVVIDGRLQQMQNEIDKAKQKVRKCPSCGEIIPAMTAVCPSCGQVIDTSNPDNKALQKYMDQLEEALVKLKKDGAENFNHEVRARLEGMIRQGKALYGDNKKINYLISEVEASIKEFETKHHKSHIIHLCIIAISIVFVCFCCARCLRWCSESPSETTWRYISEAIADDDVAKVKEEISSAHSSPIEHHQAEIRVYVKQLVRTGRALEAEEIAEICDGKSSDIDVSSALTGKKRIHKEESFEEEDELIEESDAEPAS